MSLDAAYTESPAIESIDQLIAWIREGERPVAEHRFGLEHEKLGVLEETGEPLPLTGERSIRRVLERLAEVKGGRLLEEEGTAIGVQLEGATLSLEPGGQLELSGNPSHELDELCREVTRHLAEVRQVSRPLKVAWLGVGYRPWGPREQVPWLPRGRYGLMRRRLPGTLAHDMMQMTASLQTSFDFASEEDLAAKVSTATAVSPLVAAMFANSPLIEGRPCGYKSFRYHVWSDVDAARCGLVRTMFEPGFSYRSYVEWALDAPLLFIRRRGTYVDPGGRTLRDVIREGFLDEPATMVDWGDLLSTLFPEVRVKRVIELRSADAVNAKTTTALPALWAGVLYDPQARADARRLVDCTFEELVAFQEEVARHALEARLGGVRAGDLASDLLRIAEEGLRRRFERQESSDERRHLAPLQEIVASGVTGADRLLEVYERTGGDRAAIIEHLRY